MHASQKNIFNFVFGINILVLFLVAFENSLVIPSWLQVMGRMHPMLLHFPITLVSVFLFWHFVLLIKLSDQNWAIKIDEWLLLATALTTSVTALMGFFLSNENGYDKDALFWHKWSGIAIALIMSIWYGFRSTIQKNAWVNYSMASISLFSIFLLVIKAQ